jgi:hypothetical protein
MVLGSNLWLFGCQWWCSAWSWVRIFNFWGSVVVYCMVLWSNLWLFWGLWWCNAWPWVRIFDFWGSIVVSAWLWVRPRSYDVGGIVSWSVAINIWFQLITGQTSAPPLIQDGHHLGFGLPSIKRQMPGSIQPIFLAHIGGDYRKVPFNDQLRRSSKIAATDLVSVYYRTNAWVDWLSTSRIDGYMTYRTTQLFLLT